LQETGEDRAGDIWSSKKQREDESRLAPDSPEQPSRLLLAGLAFDLVGPVVLAQAADGFLEYQPHTRYKGFGRDRLNPYGLGPFCKFKVGGLPAGPGLYAFVIDGVPVYVGKTEDFRGRMGPVNYGSISPVNCCGKGQSTNCKINSGVLQAAKAGRHVAVYVQRTSNLGLEGAVIAAVRPPWNGRHASGISLPAA